MSLQRYRKFLKPIFCIVALYALLQGLADVLIRNLGTELAKLHPRSTIFSSQPRPRTQSTPLELHNYRKDGLLEVNLEGPHPIHELVGHAEDAWRQKLSRASKTLQEAVTEYRRRYRRSPPLGFDLWWKYAQENNVVLPDEYDTIFHDLEPFWGLKPAVLREIQQDLEKNKDSFTIGKNTTGGDVDVLTYAFNDGSYKRLIVRASGIIGLLQPLKDHLPMFRMTISPHDAPNRLTDYSVMQVLRDAASLGYEFDREALPKAQNLGWSSACPPYSPLRSTSPTNLDESPPPRGAKSFIYDHVKSMDPCNHAHLLHFHGQLLSHNNGPSPQTIIVPEFSSCNDLLHHNIRLPTPYAWVEDIYPRSLDPAFNNKTDERLLWRGSNTGIFHGPSMRWEKSHRNHLVAFANDMNVNGTVQVLNPDGSSDEKNILEYGTPEVNSALFDVSFAGKPLTQSTEIRDRLLANYPWTTRQGSKEAGQYKYVFDIDGNGWSGRFKRLITSNSLVFKSTIYPEWFADRIQPWLHYVPIQLDLSDLYDALIFFRGDLDHRGAHEDLARKIAEAGRQWSKEFWRQEDLTSYMFRLVLEFARLMSEDREANTYQDAI